MFGGLQAGAKRVEIIGTQKAVVYYTIEITNMKRRLDKPAAPINQGFIKHQTYTPGGHPIPSSLLLHQHFPLPQAAC
jgi:hypothetical protein